MSPDQGPPHHKQYADCDQPERATPCKERFEAYGCGGQYQEPHRLEEHFGLGDPPEPRHDLV